MNGREEINYDMEIISNGSYNDKLGKLTSLMTEVLTLVNPNASNSILQKTPERFSKALLEFVEGYDEDIAKLLNDAMFDSEGFDDIVIIRNIEFTSLCEHHLLPFFGKCTVGYIPRDKILGLSKFPRLIQTLAKKMNIQERLTKEIAEVVQEYLNPLGVVVLTSASHACMCFRGVKSFHSQTDTIYSIGCLKEAEQLNKFFNVVNCGDNKR
jgi:GTP cyclohydrolase I